MALQTSEITENVWVMVWLQREESLFLLFVFLQIKRPLKNPTLTWKTWEEEGWNQDFVKYGTQKRKLSGKSSMTSAWTCNRIGSYRVHLFRVRNTFLCQSSWNCKCCESRIKRLIPFSSFSGLPKDQKEIPTSCFWRTFEIRLLRFCSYCLPEVKQIRSGCCFCCHYFYLKEIAGFPS